MKLQKSGREQEMNTKFSTPVAIVMAVAATLGLSPDDTPEGARAWGSDLSLASFANTANESQPTLSSSGMAGGYGAYSLSDRSCGSWTAGANVEATFLWPTINSMTATTELFDYGGGTHLTRIGNSEAGGDMLVAPRIWLGAKRDCWGIGARYWTMEQDSLTGNPVIAIPTGDRFSLQRSLEAYTFDLEVTRDVCVLGCDMILAFGGRYAYLQNTASSDSAAVWTATGPPFVTTSMSTASALGQRQFEGTGFSFGAQATHQINCRWHLFWNLRGSFLWGDGTLGAITSATVVDSAGAYAAQETWALAGDSREMFIGEFQVGLEHQRALKCAPYVAFVRCAFEYQYWNTGLGVQAASLSAAATSTTGPPPTDGYGAIAAACAGDASLDLIGFSIAAGLKY